MDLTNLTKELIWDLRCDCGATMPLARCIAPLAKDMLDDLRELIDPISVAQISATRYSGNEAPMVGGVTLPKGWILEHHTHELWMVCKEADWEGRVKKRDPDVRNRPGLILGPDGQAAKRPGASGLVVLPGGKS